MAYTFDNVDATIEFSLRLFGLLRQSGIRLGTLQTLACTRAIALLGAIRQDELLSIYRTTLINRKQDRVLLHRLYTLLLELYFSPSDAAQSTLQELERNQVVTVERQLSMGEGSADNDNEDDGSTYAQGYSINEVDHHKDLRMLPQQAFPAVLEAFKQIARKNAAIARRKSKRSKRGGVIDLRSSIRESVRFDGDVLEWRFKKKTPTHTRLVVVVDVSGSMEVYSVFLLNFLHLLYQNQRLKIEVFVFSTELKPLTQYFRLKNFRDMLENISIQFAGWSGGTKIGQALFSLNEDHRSTVTPSTMVTIISDGWDTGESELLEREMAKLAHRAKSIVWINPLKGDPSYEPLAQGMATALPYCDEFISGHSIESLEGFASKLARSVTSTR